MPVRVVDVPPETARFPPADTHEITGLSIVNASADEPTRPEMVTVGESALDEVPPVWQQLNDEADSHWLVEQTRWPKEMDGV